MGVWGGQLRITITTVSELERFGKGFALATLQEKHKNHPKTFSILRKDGREVSGSWKGGGGSKCKHTSFCKGPGYFARSLDMHLYNLNKEPLDEVWQKPSY